MKKYKCIKSYDNLDVGTIYSEYDKPDWFENYKNLKDFVENSIIWERYFQVVVSKELTELPEKWCISRNLSKENNEIVTSWVNKMCGGAYISQNFADDWYLSNYQHGNKRDYTDYTEITFDQFKKWVLKEENMDKIENFTYEGFTYEVGKCYLYDNQLLIKFIGKDKQLPTLGKRSNDFYYSRWNLNLNHRRIATEEETKWLEACIAANKYIPKEEVIKISDDWCVKITQENREVIIKWWGDNSNDKKLFTIGAYYGIKDRIKKGSDYKWDNVITTEEFYEKIGHKVDKKHQSLVGRYLKASVDNVQGTSMKKGEFLKITKENSTGGTGESTSTKWEWTHSYIKEGKWELMPEGWVPEVDSEVPEYVECKAGAWNSSVSKNSYLYEGQIFKVIRFDKNVASHHEGTYFCEGDTALYKNTVIPSTKEAFDKQNKPKESSNLVCGVNLIPGEVYSAVQDTGTHWIMRFYNLLKDDSCINSSSVNLASKNFYKESTPYWGSKYSIKSIRLATPEEKAHFEACEKAGKYVNAPLDKSSEWIREAKSRFKTGQNVIDLTGYTAKITDNWEVMGDYLYNNGNLISQYQ